MEKSTGRLTPVRRLQLNATLRGLSAVAQQRRDPVNARVMAWPVGHLVDRLVEKEHMPVELATSLAADAKRFVYLCALQGEGAPRLSPPELIDVAWHHFILFTRDYARFCDELFGRFIHHTPFTRAQREAMVASRTERDGIERARDAAAEVFSMLSPNWFAIGYDAANGSLGFGCSDCEGSTNCGGNDPPCC